MHISDLLPRFPAALLVVLLLAACQSTDERAAGHLASAETLLAEGDSPRALVELRNALALKSDLHAARKLLADTLLASGDPAGAYQQYTELADLQPNDLESRIALGRLLLSQSAWADFERIVTAAANIDPMDDRVISLVLARDYQQAATDNNITARNLLAARAADLRTQNADDPALIRIAIDQALLQDQPATALPLIDMALSQQPIDQSLQDVKLRLLLEQGDGAQIVDQFKAMIALFPADTQLPANLLRWYVSRNDLAGAEAYLRERAGSATAEIDGHAGLIEFLRATKGPEAALAELGPLIAANEGDPKADLYLGMQASIVFETGDRAAALATIAEILARTSPSNQTRRIKALYANMLTTVGDRPNAEAVIEEILAEDASNVDALLLRASWRLVDDRTSDAIIDLRSALNQEPNNARILAALASAYVRDGSIELASETLGRAVEVAPLEPAYAREYARMLLEQGRTEIARSVLYTSWQANLADIGLVEMLSALAINTADVRLAAELVGLLRSSDAPEAQSAANQLESAVLVIQERFDDALPILDAEIAKAEDKAPWILLKIDALERADRADEAAALLVTAIAEHPEDTALLHAQASRHISAQQPDRAMKVFRSILALDPADELATRQLFSLLQTEGQPEEAAKVLAAGLDALPRSVDLRWIKASELQAQGDMTGAIAIYETLYAENTANPVIANNLASLLSQTTDDAATIERASRIARRFRASQVPEFQDTHGWLLHRSGNSAAALPFLESAAAALPEDSSVQFHYGSVLAALGRTEEAKTALSRVIAMSADGASLYVERAKALIDDLATAQPSP